MRNAKDLKRVAHLTDIAKKLNLPEERLQFFSADLTQSGSFDAAIQGFFIRKGQKRGFVFNGTLGCDGVIHIANVVQLSAKDPIKEIIEPSVNGLKTVLTAIEKEPRVKTLVLTSR